MSNLEQRLLTAVIVIPILLFLFWLGGLWVFFLIELVILLGMIEFSRMLQAKEIPVQRELSTAAALLLGVCAYFGKFDLMVLTLTLSAIVILAAQLSGKNLKKAIYATSGSMLGVIYVGLLMSHAILLRNWEGRAGRVDAGLFFIIFLIAVTFLNDAGAFFIGRKWGTHKMTPVISPKKSWEGVGGAFVFGVAGAVAVKLIFDRWIIDVGLPWAHCIILGAVLVGVAILGDLVESLFKRDAGIKDAGAIVPGHGGLLDRLDALVFTLPVCFYYLKFIAYY